MFENYTKRMNEILKLVQTSENVNISGQREKCKESTKMVASQVLEREQPGKRKYDLRWSVKKLLQRRIKHVTEYYKEGEQEIQLNSFMKGSWKRRCIERKRENGQIENCE